MVNREVRWLGGLCALALSLFLGAPAQAADLDGTGIVLNSQSLNQGADQRSTVTLELHEADGRVRKIVTKRLWRNYEGKDGFATKTVFYTLSVEGQGTGFLIWDTSDAGKKDQLFMYLPSLRTVRKVSVRDQDDAFLGSDLTFADMGQRLLEEDVHTLVGEETLDGVAYHLVESVPRDDSMYGKRKLWINKSDFTTHQIHYFDRKQELLKTQDITWIKRDDGLRVFRELDVKNVQTGHRTIYTISNEEFNVGLKDKDFTERMLKRGYRGK